MFLKSLTMKGFKSFADPTVLEFEPGITVVVGPNGSGKSNVVDAVCWVLGAQGPRSLRSAKMEDVIFAGTSARPALGRAEVTLTIDNSSGLLPVDMAEVRISRTLFRNGDSEYAINGSTCRLLDVQDLLSDSGVGRQQHMIVGQGQLDTILNARPEDRRGIIEEAAGVLKHRRRRERAERRLEATQENLERLGDLLREVKRQIRPLERQAVAARSHAAIEVELRATRSYLAGVELEELQGRRQHAGQALVDLTQEEDGLRRLLESLDESARATAAELAARRAVDLGTALGRLQGLVERARGTQAVIRERGRALRAALDAAADLDVVSTLEAEGARLTSELGATRDATLGIGPEREAYEAACRLLAAEEHAFLRDFGDAAEIDRLRIDRDLAGSKVEGIGETLRDRRGQLDALAARTASLEAEAEALGEQESAATGRIRDLGHALEAGRAAAGHAEAAAKAAEDAVGAAQARFDEADALRHRNEARADVVSKSFAEFGSGRAEADGHHVVGVLSELVEVDDGWEGTVEAALGPLNRLVVVDDESSVRDVLRRFSDVMSSATVLRASGLAALDPGRGAIPGGAELLRAHVRANAGAPQVISALLDATIGNVVRVESFDDAIELALARPDLVVVGASGERLASSGPGVAVSRALSKSARDAAEEEAARAAERAGQAAEDLRAAREEREQAWATAHESVRAADQIQHLLDSAVAEEARSRSEAARNQTAVETARRERDALEEATSIEVDRLAGAERALAELEETYRRVAEREGERREIEDRLEARRSEVGRHGAGIEVHAAELNERQRLLQDRLAEVERRLSGRAQEREEAAERRIHLERDGVALERLARLVEHEGARLEAALGSLQDDYHHQAEAVRVGSERLDTLRNERAEAESRLTDVRDRSRNLDLEAAEAALRVESLVEMTRRDLGRDPAELVGSPCPELPEGVSPAAHARALSDQLESMGPVNPLALEELSVLEERHRELDTQVADIRSARRELQEVIQSLNDEIVQTFAAAAADVNEHFSALVASLFPGGVGRLVLSEPDDLLNTGVEIEVRPAGRNIRRVSLLSGGERSLAALAFLFAVFRSRPSPFYLLDEVEAALDDVNLSRFLGLVKEFRDEAQLIVISHQKRTMETGDALYGVTMAPGGSSQVISQRVEREVGLAS